MDRITQVIRNVVDKQNEGQDNRHIEAIIREKWRQRGKENQKDRDIFNTFKELTEKHREKNEDKFRIWYIRETCRIHEINPDIVIFLSKKNVGKTRQVFKLMEDCLYSGTEMFLLRTQSNEIISAVLPEFEDPAVPFMLKARASGTYTIVQKPSDPMDAIGKKFKYKKVGTCCSISTANRFMGPEYANTIRIVWDECITDGARVKITPADIRTFERLISSVKRSKEKFEVFAFGNLLEKSNGLLGDPLLNYYGINYTCAAKWIQKETPEQASILYINSGDLFKGIEAQGVVGGVDVFETESLLRNQMSEKGIMTIDENAFYGSSPIYSFLFSYNLSVYIIQVRFLRRFENSDYWIIKLEHFNESRFLGDVYTGEEILANTYSNSVIYLNAEDMGDLIEQVNTMLIAKKCFYASDNTRANMVTLWNHLRHKYPVKNYFKVL